MQNASSPDDSWRREFPRFAELRATTPSIEPGTYFQGIPHAVANNSLAREFYRELESDLAELCEDAWSAFKAKLQRCVLRPHGHRHYTGVVSVLYEAKGYRCLKHYLEKRGIEFDRILLIPEKDGQKTPDWVAVSRGVPVAVLEVKTVNESDEQSKYVRGEPTMRPGNPTIPAALRQKLQSTVDGAKKQLDAYGSEKNILRIAFLIVHFDYPQAAEEDNYEVIGSFLDGLSVGIFEVAYQFRGLNAPHHNNGP